MVLVMKNQTISNAIDASARNAEAHGTHQANFKLNLSTIAVLNEIQQTYSITKTEVINRLVMLSSRHMEDFKPLFEDTSDLDLEIKEYDFKALIKKIDAKKGKKAIRYMWNTTNPREIVFFRRSDSKQSKYDISMVEDEVSLEYSPSITMLMLCDDSSSFRDLAFLKALQLALKFNAKISIYRGNRSDDETVTRSSQNMRIFADFAEKNHMFNVIINGHDLFYDAALLIFLAQINEGKWLNNANSQYSAKLEKFSNFLKANRQDRKAFKFTENEEKELNALLRYNRKVSTTLQFIVKRKMRKHQLRIKSLKEGIKKFKEELKEKELKKALKELKEAQENLDASIIEYQEVLDTNYDE